MHQCKSGLVPRPDKTVNVMYGIGQLTLGVCGPVTWAAFGATDWLATGDVLSGLSMVYRTGSQPNSPFRKHSRRELGLP